jgi:thymidylate synthase ThyX
MKLLISGNLRSIANSAWVSTLDESKTNQKSDEEVIRVVSFLAKEHHTTPFECVSLSFYQEKSSSLDSCDDFAWEIADLSSSPYAKIDFNNRNISIVTIDLFNFIKTCKTIASDRYKESSYWKLFESQDPLMASIVDRFQPPPSYSPSTVDYGQVLGENNGITVDLIDVHNPGVKDHLRATWRICAPLSIAVQMLRHRTGCFNMTSGRYRTLNQDMVSVYDDILSISSKVDHEFSDSVSQLFSKEQQSIVDYQWLMNKAKESKKSDKISNEEYKRLREYFRYILPEGRMTELYATFYYPDFQHYLMLRDSSHAQVEHAYIAQIMKKTLDDFLNKNI